MRTPFRNVPREEIEARLDDSRVGDFPNGAKVRTVARMEFSSTNVLVACDPAIARVAVRQPERFGSARQLLGSLAAQVGAAWRIDDGIVVFGPAVPPRGDGALMRCERGRRARPSPSCA